MLSRSYVLILCLVMSKELKLRYMRWCLNLQFQKAAKLDVIIKTDMQLFVSCRL